MNVSKFLQKQIVGVRVWESVFEREKESVWERGGQNVIVDPKFKWGEYKWP